MEIIEHAHEYDIRVTVATREVIAGAEIASKGLIDTHYGLIAERAVNVKPTTWLDDVSASKKEGFTKKWSTNLADANNSGKILNITEYLAKHSKESAESINDQWDKNGSFKLLSGTYIGRMDTGDFVVNAFYGILRAKFIDPSVQLVLFSVTFKESDLSWKEFRNQVIGATDPSLAAKGSFRQILLQNHKEMALASLPNMQVSL